MMKEQAISKINKVGKISTVVAIICKILVILGFVTCLIGTILCLVFPKDVAKITTSETMTTEINYNALGIEVPESELEEIEEMQSWMDQGYEVRVETVQNGMMSGSMAFSSVGQIFTTTDIVVSNGTVRTDMVSEDVSYNLWNLAGLLMVAMIALAMTVVTLTFIEGLCKAFRDCQSPFEENVVKKMQRLAYALIPWTVISSMAESVATSFLSGNINWSISLDMGVVLVVLIVLVLVYIFKYGAVLQQESDETL